MKHHYMKLIYSGLVITMLAGGTAFAQIGDIKNKPVLKSPSVKVPLKQSVKRDADGDGRLSLAHGGDDCDDNDANRFPGNVEVADTANHDEDCDASTFGFVDRDGDGFGADYACNIDQSGAKICGRDCDDGKGWVHPNQIDIFNGKDDNCSGSVDEHQSAQDMKKLLGLK